MDVAVVGAGIIGCGVARQLARRGTLVTVFDPRGPGRGATYASAGVLAPYVEAHQSGPLQDLIVRSLSMYDSFVADVEQDAGLAVEYARCGSLELASDDHEAEMLQRIAASGAVRGARWVTPTGLADLEPAISDGFRGGLLIDEHGYVDAPVLAEALYRAALSAGVRFVKAQVDVVRSSAGHPFASVGGDLHQFDRIVVAAGSWSTQIAAAPTRTAVVFPVKGQLLRLRLDATTIRRILWSSDCYLVPRRGAHMLVGATMEHVGFDEEVTEAAVSGLRRAAERLVPAVCGAELVDARAGLRPATADGLPILGQSSVEEGVIFATGHFRNGVVLAPITAAAVADLVCGAPLDRLYDPFAASRFDL